MGEEVEQRRAEKYARHWHANYLDEHDARCAAEAQVEALKGLLDRAVLCLPDCYLNLRADITAALSAPAEERKREEGRQTNVEAQCADAQERPTGWVICAPGVGGEAGDLFRWLAPAWFYGGFQAETYGERQQQRSMEAAGWWPIASEDELHAKVQAWEAAKEAEAEAEESSEQVGWRPIETAPKDGSDLLLICASAYAPAASEGWWADASGGPGWYHYSRPEDKWHGGVGRWFPTHWMPLPAPPAGRTGSEAYTAEDGQPRDAQTCTLSPRFACDECGAGVGEFCRCTPPKA